MSYKQVSSVGKLECTHIHYYNVLLIVNVKINKN